jgi:DNA-binding MarR family transcriptional regulator
VSATRRDEEIVDLLRDVNRTLRERLMQGAEGKRRSLATLSLLRVLAREPGISLSELARRACMPKSLVSIVIADLSDDRLVKKVPDRGDLRLVRLHLTATGTRELGRWRAAYRAIAAEEIGTLAPEDAAQLLSGLRALRDVMTRAGADRAVAP